MVIQSNPQKTVGFYHGTSASAGCHSLLTRLCFGGCWYTGPPILQIMVIGRGDTPQAAAYQCFFFGNFAL
jgi:hypothetical protein